MSRPVVTLVALAWSLSAAAADSQVTLTVDLRNPVALEQVRQSNPAHYEKLRQILAGLAEQPQRAEVDWLQTTFSARDVALSKFFFKTSNPPRQALSFTLDNVRYTMHLTRSDLGARSMALH